VSAVLDRAAIGRSVVAEANGSSVIGRGLRAALSALPPSTASYLQRTLFEVPGLGRGLRLISGSAAAGEGVIRHGPARGLRIDATGTLLSFVLGTCDPDEQELVVTHLRDGGVFYDLGANIGFFSLLAARLVGPTGHVIAFEPSPQNAAQLRRNIDLNGFTNITLVETAVSSEEGFAQLDTTTKERGQMRLTASDEAARVGLVPVRTVSIDGWRDETGFPPPAFMKIDVEGAEVAALRGAHVAIESGRPVLLVEIHKTVGPMFAEYFEQTLRPLGYRGTSLTGGPMPLSDERHHVVLVPAQAT
jgi:FkbM family methyltransferase